MSIAFKLVKTFKIVYPEERPRLQSRKTLGSPPPMGTPVLHLFTEQPLWEQPED